MIIRNIAPSDASDWELMRRDLWPEVESTHATEIASYFAGTLAEPQAVLVAQEGSMLAGFVELSIRDDIPVLRGKRVGYVEGLYVSPGFRARGVARHLLAAARLWARKNGCDAFASDRAGRLIIDGRF